MNRNEELAKRIYFLEEKHNEYTREDLARLSRYAITVVSAVIAVIGFLIANGKQDLIKHPNILQPIIYLVVIVGLTTVILEFINAYLFSSLTEVSKDLEIAKFKADQKSEELCRSKRNLYAKLVDVSRILTLITATVGLILIMIFSVCVLNNLLS